MQSLPLYEGVDWNGVMQKVHNAVVVSLFTREWIEIEQGTGGVRMKNPSPSLRGSGLKYYCAGNRIRNAVRLPLYEGVDWNKIHKLRILFLCIVSLFTREWIEILKSLTSMLAVSPVSLFTREWIEINITGDLSDLGGSLPLYEGVDWNAIQRVIKIIGKRLPLYEGVDWNRAINTVFTVFTASPSLRGSGLKSSAFPA